MTAVLIRQFLDLLTRGLIAPRPTVRNVIDMRPDLAQRLLLVALAAALQGALWALVSLVAQGIGGGIGFGGQLRLAFQVFVNYVLTSTIAFHVGRHFGGTGSPSEVASAVAWHAMLTAALTPVLALAVGGQGPQAGLSLGGALMIMVYAGFNLWLLANCIAEAHGFTSVGRVAAATFGISVVLGMLLLAMVGGIVAM
jgi:hypothetical protein